MSKQDRSEFIAYLQNCTDAQVQGVLEKEKAAGRRGYAQLAQDEKDHRGIN